MREPLDILARYGAARSAVTVSGTEQVREGEGGRLGASVEAHGIEPLAGLLWSMAELEALELVDADVTLRLVRNGVGAALSVAWASGEVFEETVDLAPHPGLDEGRPSFLPDSGSRIHDVAAALSDPSRSLFVVEGGEGLRWYGAGHFGSGGGALPLVAQAGPCQPLGPASFRRRHGLRANYLGGAMAGAISSAAMVQAMGESGMLCFFGAGGLPLPEVEKNLIDIKAVLGDRPAGFNLLHNPVEPAIEDRTVELFLEHGCTYVSASAFMGLTPAITRYRYTGIHLDDSGAIVCPNRVFAKVSRTEVAEHFLRPAPTTLLAEIVAAGGLTESEAELASHHPMADAITAEADSGGHTDRRPLPVLLPLILRQRDRVSRELAYAERGIEVFVGAAGGLGSPESIVAAFAMGADFVLTGSVNQATTEAGTSASAKAMLLEAGMADVGLGPAPDMFELGAHVQVLSRGTMFANRGTQLYAVYKEHADWDLVPEKTRKKIEKQILGRPFADVWSDCVDYWSERDIGQIERAEAVGRHKMALVFRWYLGMSSRWARIGDTKRKRDYQIWCGPAMGAFNDWVAGTTLEPLEARGVVRVADALLEAAAVLARARRLEARGVPIPAEAWQVSPS